MAKKVKILAGMDGGGTRTRLALARADGTVLAFAEGGCVSFAELGRAAAQAEMGRLWREAWAHARLPAQPADALFLGSGSILHAEDSETNGLLAVAEGLARTGGVRAENDAWNALAGALPGRPGILLIAGTGSACLGRNAQRATWRAGGWGHLLNDAGSAYQLGMAAMVAATRAADGRGPTTALSPVVCEHLGLRDLTQIYRKLHHEGVTRARVAALAPQVVAQADAGDDVARALLGDGAQGLVEMVVAVAARLGLEKPALALTGGLLTNAARYREEFLARLAQALPGFTVAGEGLPPVLGAVILAAEHHAGAAVGASFLENLRASAARFPGISEA